MKSKLLNKKNLLYGILILLFISAGSVIFILYNEPAPQLLTFGNPNGDYVIEKSDEGVYTVSYQDPENDIKGVMISSSPVDLAPFIGKKVQIHGDFRNHADTQCIAGKCQDIGGPYVGLDINYIQEK